MKEEYTVYSCDICGKRSQTDFTRKVTIPAWNADSVPPYRTAKQVDMCDECLRKYHEIVSGEFASCEVGDSGDYIVKKRF